MHYRRYYAGGRFTEEGVELIVHLSQDESVKESLKKILEREKDFNGHVEVFKMTKAGYDQNYTYMVKNGKLERVY